MSIRLFGSYFKASKGAVSDKDLSLVLELATRAPQRPRPSTHRPPASHPTIDATVNRNGPKLHTSM